MVVVKHFPCISEMNALPSVYNGIHLYYICYYEDLTVESTADRKSEIFHKIFFFGDYPGK